MIRFTDATRTVELSVRDLAEGLAPTGDLRLSVVQSLGARAAEGRRAHADWQRERAAGDAAFRAEVRVRVQVEVEGWTAVITGRVDGLTREGERVVVEELKSSTLPAHRLVRTTAADHPGWVEQLELYLWILWAEGGLRPTGRLVLVSRVDGARHLLGVPLDVEAVDARVRARLAELVRGRERRIAWMAARRERSVPVPYDRWRPGQRAIAEAVQWGLEAGHPVLVEAPTGLGKTGAVLVGALRYALAHGKQVFWATQRTTQQRVVAEAVGRLRARGLALRALTLYAREKVCLNEVVACRPEACRFARDHHDKLREAGQPHRLARAGIHVQRGELLAAARACEACPHALGLALSDQVDLVVGDVNYAFDPSVALRRHFGESASDWVVVVDEVHQLADRARGWYSPRVEAGLGWLAAASLRQEGERFAPFAELAARIARAVEGAVDRADGPEAGPERRAPWPGELLAAEAAAIDAVGLDYAVLRAEAGGAGDLDPFQELCRQVLRFRAGVEAAGEETVAVATARPGARSLGLLCLDPSPHLGPRIARLGGFAGCSATLRPVAFHRDLLGLDPKALDVVRVPSPFPREHRAILVAPRVSTLYRDREEQAPRTAALLEACALAVPGNTAVYFPSFAMLEDICARWSLPGRALCVQRPEMDDAERQALLDRLGAEGPPVVLAAVLGGVFAEGVDLPPGALSAVFIAGPALPPVGLERDLLRAWCEERYGAGFAYASLVPGITRVVQAAGRLIRREEDRGVVLLVGQRFRWREIRALLPEEWELMIPDDPALAIADFFSRSTV